VGQVNIPSGLCFRPSCLSKWFPQLFNLSSPLRKVNI
jgi:hypothetical protein